MTDAHWRLIDSGPGEAGWNMAVDEALLLSAANPGFPPTLRFFTWDRPSLSIGSFQNARELNLERIKSQSVPLVRRPTGGRAVLHDAELTYSITCPIPSVFFPSGLMGSYKAIGACFLRGLDKCGLTAELLPVDRDSERKRHSMNSRDPLCFSSPSWYEVLVRGKKLIGSAQRRIKSSFLQQGSLLIGLDIEGLLSLLNFGDETSRRMAGEKLSSKMTALKEHGVDADIHTLKGALTGGFEAEMGVRLVPGKLTAEETVLADRLLAEKYSQDEWNLFRRAARQSG